MRISDWSSDVCSSDLVDAGDAQGGAEFGVLLRRDVDADHAIDAGLGAFGGEPFGAADRHRIGITHQDERRFGVALAEGGGDRENVGGGRAFGEAAQVRGLDRGTIGHRIGEGHAKLDHIGAPRDERVRSEEHTSELQSLMRISYAVFCLKKKIKYISIPLTTLKS